MNSYLIFAYDFQCHQKVMFKVQADNPTSAWHLVRDGEIWKSCQELDLIAVVPGESAVHLVQGESMPLLCDY